MMNLFFHSEFENTFAFISLSRLEDDRRPFRLVGAVGIVLGFQANGGTLVVDDAFLAAQGAVKEIAGIDLYAWFIGIDFQRDAACGRSQLGCQLCNVAIRVQHPVVVIAVAVFHLLELELVNVLSHSFRGGEVHRRVFHRKNLPGGHVGAVHRSICVGIDIQDVIRGRLGRVAGKVEIGVVGHVDDRFLVGCRFIFDIQRIVACQSVSHCSCDSTGEVLVSVGRVHGHGDHTVVHLLSFIDLVLPSLWAAMQAMAKIVGRQLDGVAVNHQDALVDAVGITADGCTKVAGLVDVIRDAVESKYDIAQRVVFVRHHDGHDTTTEVGDADFHAIGIFDGKQTCRFAVDFAHEILRVKSRHG